MTKRQLERLADKLHRLCYVLEADGARLLNAGEAYRNHGYGVIAVASTLGKIVRALEAKNGEETK